MARERRKSQSAKDLIEGLKRDPRWVTRKIEQQLNAQARQRQIEADSASVIQELRENGLEVSDISDLFNKRLNYKHAIPILLRWLPRVSNPRVKESIVRALSVRFARKQAAATLITEFYEAASDCSALRWAIGNALDVVADDSVVSYIIEIATDTSYGRDREMVVLSLKNMQDPKVIPVLRRLLKDETVRGFAVMALGKLRAKVARKDIEKLLSAKPGWIASEASKALKRIEGRPVKAKR